MSMNQKKDTLFVEYNLENATPRHYLISLSPGRPSLRHTAFSVGCSAGTPITGVVLRSDSIQSCLHWQHFTLALLSIPPFISSIPSHISTLIVLGTTSQLDLEPDFSIDPNLSFKGNDKVQSTKIPFGKCFQQSA